MDHSSDLRAKSAKAFQFILGGTATIALLVSLFPYRSPEAGFLLYFILWPFLGLQLAAAFLPWGKFAQKRARVTLVVAIIISLFARNGVYFMLSLTGYVGQ